MKISFLLFCSIFFALVSCSDYSKLEGNWGLLETNIPYTYYIELWVDKDTLCYNDRKTYFKCYNFRDLGNRLYYDTFQMDYQIINDTILIQKISDEEFYKFVKFKFDENKDFQTLRDRETEYYRRNSHSISLMDSTRFINDNNEKLDELIEAPLPK